LHAPFDEATQKEVRELMKNETALRDAFFKDLSFGTGGMRGLMGAGTNRMNVYTVRAATQGLANYLKMQSGNHSVFIGYDVRNHSREFALEAARVLAGNGMTVYLTKDICPTPLVSYGCRHFKCSAAIMITASHNPPAYNGYKVYWSDGGQVVPPHDEGIMAEVRKVSVDSDIPMQDSYQIIGTELDQAYLAELKNYQLYPASPIKILYTPLHGTGIRIIPEALKSFGYMQVRLVEEQKTPDGNFTNAHSPNPEEKAALELGTKQLLHEKEDLLIATDPDADRMGVVALDGEKAVALTGNQIACLCLHHICTALTARKEFPENAAFIKTIVTTELFSKIAKSFGGACFDVLTGFKYIAEKMTLWEQSFSGYQYIFGAEESYGYLFGTMVRDKDAISSACLIAEVAALAKKQNLSLIDRLYQIYQKFGLHRETLVSLSFNEGEAGMDQMKLLMEKLRKNPPKTIGNIPVIKIEDYLKPTLLPKSDVLRFWLKDHSKLVIRPSGTEPKVKIYAEVRQEVQDLDKDILACDGRLKKITDELCSVLRY